MLPLGREHDSDVVLSGGHVWVIMPELLKSLPQHILKMSECLIMAALLKACSGSSVLAVAARSMPLLLARASRTRASASAMLSAPTNPCSHVGH